MATTDTPPPPRRPDELQRLREANAVLLAACREALAFVGDPALVISKVAAKRRVTAVLRDAIAQAADPAGDPQPGVARG